MATRKLVSGAPRVLPNHTTPAGRCYLDAYKALEQRYGPFVDEVARMEASRTAFAWVELQASQLELVQAREKLATAKGRHSTAWNARAVQRLSKRQGLNDATYVSATRRLEQITASTRVARPLSPTELLSRVGHGAASS